MKLTLRQVTYFIAVAEAGSVSGGAVALGISQSALTESLKQLEGQTGARLFTRHSKGVELTYQGHQFLRHARLILSTVADAERSIAARPEAVEGLLHLGVTSMVSGYFLAHILARFRAMFPNVDIRVVEDERSYIEHLLVNGELSIGLMIVSSLQDTYALDQEVLTRSRFRVWLPPDHALCRVDRIALDDLADQPLIALATDEISETVGKHWRSTGHSPSTVLKTSSVEAVRSLVATGLGLAVLPDIAYRPWSLEGDRIEARPIADPLPSLDLGMTWRRGSILPETAQQFLTMAREDAALRNR